MDNSINPIDKLKIIVKIREWLKDNNVKNYKINDTGSLDVYENVNLIRQELTELPIKFGKIEGNFLCCDNNLTSLNGAPEYVSGIFSCARNQITSLAGCPKEIRGDFICCVNKLSSLADAPISVGGDFNCSNNEINDISNIPTKHIGENFYGYCNNLSDISVLDNIVKGKIYK